MNVRYTAVFEQVGDGWMAFAEELPGANTQGRTLEEARENLKEAIQLILEANRELAQQRSEGEDLQGPRHPTTTVGRNLASPSGPPTRSAASPPGRRASPAARG